MDKFFCISIGSTAVALSLSSRVKSMIFCPSSDRFIQDGQPKLYRGIIN